MPLSMEIFPFISVAFNFVIFQASCIDSLQGLAGDNIIMLGAAAVGFGCIQVSGNLPHTIIP